jgi:hypothetical protein
MASLVSPLLVDRVSVDNPLPKISETRLRVVDLRYTHGRAKSEGARKFG